MTLGERIEQLSGAFWAAIGASLGAGVFTILRKILTDSARITALETRLDTQNEHRKERDEAQMKMMTEVRNDVKSLFRKDDL